MTAVLDELRSNTHRSRTGIVRREIAGLGPDIRRKVCSRSEGSGICGFRAPSSVPAVQDETLLQVSNIRRRARSPNAIHRSLLADSFRTERYTTHPVLYGTTRGC